MSLRGAVTAMLLVVAMLPAKADTFTYKDADGLYYLCNEETLEAVLIASQSADDDYVYTDDVIHIPATVTVSGSSLGSGGGSESSRVYKVTEIGEAALKDCWAFTITFGSNSNLRIIRKQGLYGISVSGTFTLPEGLQVIEEEGLYVKSPNSAIQFVSTLVIPASLDTLGKSAIVLNKLQTLQFLGITPPKCHYTDDSNPWTGTDTATPKDVQIQIPTGTDDAYGNRKGIGNYFSFFPETPTGTEEIARGADGSSAIKVLLNGRVLILRDGRFYTMLGAPVEL